VRIPKSTPKHSRFVAELFVSSYYYFVEDFFLKAKRERLRNIMETRMTGAMHLGRRVLGLRFVAWLSICLALRLVAAAQTVPFSVTSLPTGNGPLGIANVLVPATTLPGAGLGVATVVANSGDNTVSIFVAMPPVFSQTVSGIPSPASVVPCTQITLSDGRPAATVLVTSPSDNSARLIQVPNTGAATVLRTISTGSQPFAAACIDNHHAVVSNIGDNSVTIFDPTTLTVTGTISGVAGSRSLHGITGALTSTWIAGTAANVLTVVNLSTSSVLSQIPIDQPTAIQEGPSGINVASADGNITAYDPATLNRVNNRFQSIPNPRDVIFFTQLGSLAISADNGGNASLWSFDTGTPGPIAIIPGAAALTSVSFAPKPGTPICCGIVLATNTSGNSMYVIQPPPPFVRDFILSNAASLDQSRFAPGSLASVFSVNTGVRQSIQSNSLPLPLSVSGLTVMVGGSLRFDTGSNKWVYSSTGAIPAPLLFVGPNQVNLQVPTGLTNGSSVPAQLTKPDGTTLLTTLNVTAQSPGIFSLSMDGRFQGAVLNQDFSQNGIPQVVAAAKPADRGSTIEIFATGGGDTTPSLMPGEPAPASASPLVLTNVQPTVMIGGQTAQVQFSGMAPGYVGLWQINAVIPQTVTPGNAVPLLISAGGNTSNSVTIAVQ
jgi:uncharacterized protein (TIGR03437 family)